MLIVKTVIAGAVVFFLAGNLRAASSVNVSDAYARSDGSGRTWEIGTGAVELKLSADEGALRVTGFRNKLTNASADYIARDAAMPAFLPETQAGYDVETLWTKTLQGNESADPAADSLRVRVEPGDFIGFEVHHFGSATGTETAWTTEVIYDDGERFVSSTDTALEQGPIWHYAVHCRGTRYFEYMDKVESLSEKREYNDAGHLVGMSKSTGEEERIRCTTTYVPYAMPKAAPFANGMKLQPSHVNGAARLWRAPKAGMVTLRGKATLSGGKAAVEVVHYREPKKSDVTQSAWRMVKGEARQAAVGGRPAVQLEFLLRRETLSATFRITAFPGTPILRQELEIENTGGSPVALGAADHFALQMPAQEFEHHWMYGGNSREVAGLAQQAPISPGYQKTLQGYETDYYVPWMAVVRRGGKDGWFLSTEYQTRWNFDVRREGAGNVRVTTSLPELVDLKIPAHGKLALPMVTLGVFRDSFDDMARRVYDWQYEYLWDLTRDEWYGRTPILANWYNDVHNLQENFAGRIADLDMETTDFMRTVGADLLWDDAGWSESPNIWTPSREGPDFAHTNRHVAKSDMKWLLWFCGVPSAGLMDTKIGSWGDFQWRTDGFAERKQTAVKSFWDQVYDFLVKHPRASFHTCHGGSRYSHTFETQRYADVNYFMDGGYGDETNYYFSYFETPDRWTDIIPNFGSSGPKKSESIRRLLTMVPVWHMTYLPENYPEEQEEARQIFEIYRYLVQEGVAGRRTYVAHPVIEGDDPIFYFQRLSYDRERSVIILKHRADKPVTIFPRELLPDHRYTVGFQSRPGVVTRTGADLMSTGISVKDQAPGELIYLGLPKRPGGGSDSVAPTAPGTVLSQRETTLGHSGVGVYWSSASDDTFVTYYEVSRDGEIVGKVSQGTYYFDHAAGWNEQATYAVRTVDGDGNRSAWTTARRDGDEALTYKSLGGHFRVQGREGWQAETTTDGRTYEPMTFVPPAKNPGGDFGGSGNQRGGIEGYWEAAGTARIGRGWQQASDTAQNSRTWIAPRAGEVRVLGRAMREFYRRDKGTTLRVRILHNDRTVWPASGWAEIAPGDLHGQQHALTLKVKAGDAVRFVLDRTDEPEPAVIAWMPSIVYQDTARRPASKDVVRILAGADRPYTDSTGNVWSADRFFAGGEAMAPGRVDPARAIAADDTALFERGREGEKFSYRIPVSPGRYVVRLLFAETRHEWNFERPFNLSINGRSMLKNFDVNQAARGPRRAYARVFRHLVPDANGQLVLDFSSGFDPVKKSDRAMVQAIEVVPEAFVALRFDCGAEGDHVDWSGEIWAKIKRPAKSRVLVSDRAVTQASPTLHDQKLYQTADTGRELVYRIAAPPGLYSVQLKFAELWLDQPGQRPMNIEVNGRPVRTDWDPATAAGLLGMAADIRAADIAPDKQGNITIRVTAAGKNDAILQAIAIE